MRLSDLLPWLDSLVIPLLMYGLFVMRSIRNELGNLNGRIIRIEQWEKDHDASDKEDFTEIRRSLEILRPSRRQH